MGLVSRHCPLLSWPGLVFTGPDRWWSQAALPCVVVGVGAARFLRVRYGLVSLTASAGPSSVTPLPPSLALQARPCLGRWLGPQHQACMVPRPLKQACQGPQAPSLAWLLQDR